MRTRGEQIEVLVDILKKQVCRPDYSVDALRVWLENNILEAERRAEQRARAEIETSLKDPSTVHVNMLRGSVAMPTWEQFLHLFPKERAEIGRDSERLDWLGSGCCDVRFRSEPIADTGDADVYCDIVQHHMAKPRERTIGSAETIRAAIDAAREVG